MISDDGVILVQGLPVEWTVYEQLWRGFSPEAADMTPVELLRSLMDEHDMSESDLGRLLGYRSLGHRILSGERELSKAHIRTLAKHFSLNPASVL